MMHSVEFTRNFVELTNSQQYTLSIRVTSGGFCFCVLDNTSRQFIFFKNKAFDSLNTSEIEQLINADLIFNYPYKKIIITYGGQSYSLMPYELFDANKATEILSFNQSLQTGETVKHEQVLKTNIINIYSIPENLLQFLSRKFPDASILHQSTVLISDAIRQSQEQQAKQLHIDVHADFFYATIVDNGNLILSNSFTYENTAEFAYFVLNLFSKFDLNQDETHLFFSGNISKTGDEVDMLKNYIGKIIFAEVSGYSFIPQFQELPHHELSKLFASCEL